MNSVFDEFQPAFLHLVSSESLPESDPNEYPHLLTLGKGTPSLEGAADNKGISWMVGLEWLNPAPPRKQSIGGFRRNVQEKSAHWQPLARAPHADAESTRNNWPGSPTRNRGTGERGQQTAHQTGREGMCGANGCVVNMNKTRTRCSGNWVHENHVINNCDHSWQKIPVYRVSCIATKPFFAK